MIPELLMVATGFVGRENELEIVTRLLRDDGVRIVSLTGPGGVGKTRLALHAADRLKPEFPDGVVFVSLVDVASPRLVLSTIARAVGVRDGDVATLSVVLGERRVLLVLDNSRTPARCGDRDRRFARVLQEPDVTCDQSGRSRFAWEHTVAVPPLAVPTGGVNDVDQIARIESVALFVQRARAIEPGFALQKEMRRSWPGFVNVSMGCRWGSSSLPCDSGIVPLNVSGSPARAAPILTGRQIAGPA